MEVTAAPSNPEARAVHPRGLYTLFFTEMWERFSYYGMRAFLVLFMVDSIQSGGMGLNDQVATAIYGLYTAGVYLAALPGGWLADRIFGARQAVWYGGIVIALGHLTLAIPGERTFYLGLILVVLGTGLLKPNVSTLVGELYPEGGSRRDAGFTIFYIGINLGAALGPLVCSTLAERFNWHFGFAAAAVGMALGLVQFRASSKHLEQAGAHAPGWKSLTPAIRSTILLAGLAAFVIATLCLFGAFKLNPIALARYTTVVIVAVAIIYFAAIFALGGLDAAEKKRVAVIVILFISSAIFWAGFEQAGSSLNLFAERYTDRRIESLNFLIDTGWFQSLGPVFIISLAPVMASLWVSLAKRDLNPNLAVKFGVGLLFLAAGFAVMALAAKLAAQGHKTWPGWLVTTYLVHTVGELCLSPVGLSSVTKLSPPRLVGQMMGTWFLATSLGNLIAGLLAGEFRADAVGQMPQQYMQIVYLPLAVGAALILLGKPIQKLAGAVR